MLAAERRHYILKKIIEKGMVKSIELSDALKVSTETIRKDLEQMEAEKKLKKIHGGAVKIQNDSINPPERIRGDIYSEEKQKIGEAAAKLINDNEIIIIDEGSTTLQIIRYLTIKKNITVITNSIPALTHLLDYQIRGLFEGKLIFSGGEVDINHLRATGLMSEKFMDPFYVDKAFISVHGVSLENGMTSYFSDEASLSMKFMMKCKEKIALFDHSKIGLRRFYKIADFEVFNKVICNKEAPIAWKKSLIENNITWIVAE